MDLTFAFGSVSYCVTANYINRRFIPHPSLPGMMGRGDDDYAKEFLDEMVCNAFQGIRYEEFESYIRNALVHLELFYGSRRPESSPRSR